MLRKIAQNYTPPKSTMPKSTELKKATIKNVVLFAVVSLAVGIVGGMFVAIESVTHAEEFGVSRRVPASAPPSHQQMLPYVARIIAYDSSGQSFGTGSYIGTYGEYGIVLTNHHVVSEAEGQGLLVHVHFPSAFSSYGAVVASVEKWDLALIAISKPPASVPTLPISQTPAKPNDPLWIVGFGSGTYRIAEGRCVRYMSPEIAAEGTEQLNELLEVSVSARKGDSGGPILNQRGELAGVLFGSDMIRNTAGSYSGRVNAFIMESRAKVEQLPRRPETHFASIETGGPRRSLHESRMATPNGASSSVEKTPTRAVPIGTQTTQAVPTHSTTSSNAAGNRRYATQTQPF